MKGYALSTNAQSPGEGDLSEAANRNNIRVGLIDSLRSSRDCLTRAFSVLHPDLVIVPFPTVEVCADGAPSDLDVILYYCHDAGSFETAVVQKVKVLRQNFNNLPIVVLSDARGTLEPRSIRAASNSSAQSIVSILATELPAALAAIRLAKDGGTFAQPKGPLASRRDRRSESAQPSRLTPREAMALRSQPSRAR